MRRGKPPLTLETPPPGRWTYLVTGPKRTAAVAKLEIAHSERKRKSEEIFQSFSEYNDYASDCAFCIMHGGLTVVHGHPELRSPARELRVAALEPPRSHCGKDSRSSCAASLRWGI